MPAAFPWCALLAAAIVRADGDTRTDDAVRSAMQRVADKMHMKYNMSIAAAMLSGEVNVSVAAGYTDAGLGFGVPARKALPDDVYVWGSTTKMFTGPSVLQLVEKGLVALTDPVSMHVDPILAHLNGTTLAAHFGDDIDAVQIQHLLHMTSGLSDYDGEAFAADQFANRSKDFGPVEIIGKYVSPKFKFVPGSRQDYCSTNYILLGLVLANHYHKKGSTWSWRGLDQKSVIPAALRSAFEHSEFVLSGTCRDHTLVHGFLQSYSTASLPPGDVSDLSCVGGWTAGNYIGTVKDVARFTFELYNKRRPGIVSPYSQALMTNFSAPGMGSFKFYGMGTFSLDWAVGDAEAYGHVGDTYGYQSQTTYFPSMGFAIAVATNVETTSQAQPADFTCLAYHEIVAVLTGTVAPDCSFSVPQHFFGMCTCAHAENLIV